jgi:peptidoglycan hydrolase CwlO-like protein
MTVVYRPSNEELKDLEGCLDSLSDLFDNSPFMDQLNDTYQDLDSAVTELKEKNDELVDEINELNRQIEQLENKLQELEETA